MNEWIARAPLHSFCVLPCSAENGEKEEVPEPPPEPPKKMAPPPPPPKKEEAGGGGLEFWGELEVQRVKFLVRTPQRGLLTPPLPGRPLGAFTPPLFRTPFLSSPVPGLSLRRGQAGLRAQMSPDGVRTWSQGSILGGPPLGSLTLPAQDPYSNLHTFAHLGPPASASHPHVLSRAKSNRGHAAIPPTMACFLALSLWVRVTAPVPAPPVRGWEENSSHPSQEEGGQFGRAGLGGPPVLPPLQSQPDVRG